MLKPLKHQEKFVKGYKDKAFLVHDTGTGKTICACLWLRDGRDSDALIITQKRIVKKWEKALKEWDTKGTVISKETLKKTPIKIWSAIVVDEADSFASPLFTKQRSQLSTSLYELIKVQPETPVLLATATPIRSNPWNLHTLLCFLGIYIDKKKWQDAFFTLEYRPYFVRPAYVAKEDWRTKIRPILEKYADIVLLRDCVDEIPKEQHEIINIKPVPYKSVELTPSARFYDTHQHEQLNKLSIIREKGRQYRKVIIVAYYVEQVEALAKELSKDRLTFMVHGQVKNQEELLSKANSKEVDECYLVVQAGLGVGWDGDTFSAVIFASMSYRIFDYVQIKGRVRRIHNLHPVHYIYIMAGKCDEMVYKAIQKGRDFIPSLWDETYEKVL